MVKRNLDKMFVAARNNIARTGVHINWIPDGRPMPFAYTVGLGALDAPEFIIFNAKPKMIEWWLNNFAFRIRDGVQSFSPGTLVEGLLDDYDVFLLQVGDSSQHLTLANRFYQVPGRAPVDAIQVCQPGLNRKWPWEEGCNIPQAVLGVPPDDMSAVPRVRLVEHEPGLPTH